MTLRRKAIREHEGGSHRFFQTIASVAAQCRNVLSSSRTDLVNELRADWIRPLERPGFSEGFPRK